MCKNVMMYDRCEYSKFNCVCWGKRKGTHIYYTETSAGIISLEEFFNQSR